MGIYISPGNAFAARFRADCWEFREVGSWDREFRVVGGLGFGIFLLSFINVVHCWVFIHPATNIHFFVYPENPKNAKEKAFELQLINNARSGNINLLDDLRAVDVKVR